MTKDIHTHTDKCSVGCLLKQARIERGLFITTLSQQAGIAVGQVHKLENDKVKKINPAHLTALAGPLHVPLHRLYAAAGYPVEQLPQLEFELIERLAALSPEALRSIVTMVNEFAATVPAITDEQTEESNDFKKGGTRNDT